MLGNSLKIDRSAPDRLELAEGGGCLSLFGLPFFAAGCFLLLASIKVIPFSNADEIPFWGFFVMFFMSLPFIGIGGWLMLGRKWVIFDKSLDSVLLRYGLTMPMFNKEFKMNEFRAVVISLDSGGSDSVDSFPVTLETDTGKSSLTVASFTDFGRSYDLAVELAKFANLSLKDRSSPKAKVLDAENAGAVFLDRIKAEAVEPYNAFLPGMRTTLVEEAGKLQFIIRPPKLKPVVFLPLIIPVMILTVVGPQFLHFFQKTGTPLFVQRFFTGFAMLIFFFLPAIELIRAVLRNRKSSETLTVGSEDMEIEKNGPGRSKPVSIPFNDVIDIDRGTVGSVINEVRNSVVSAESRGMYTAPSDPRVEKIINFLRPLARSKGITIKARSGIYNFGAGLPDDELNGIYAKLAEKLKGISGSKQRKGH